MAESTTDFLKKEDPLIPGKSTGVPKLIYSAFLCLEKRATVPTCIK